MYLVNKATKRPQRPSEFLGFDKFASFTACIDFDLRMEEFDDQVTARMNRRAMVDAPPQGNGPPQQAVPFYETLDQLLGLEPSPYEGLDSIEPSEESLSADEAEILERLATGEIDDFADLHRESPQCQSLQDPFTDE